MDLRYPVYARNAMTGQRHLNFIPSFVGRLLGWWEFKWLDLTTLTVAREHPKAQLINGIAQRLLPHVWSDPETVQRRAEIRVIQNDSIMNAYCDSGTMNIAIFTGIIKKIQKADAQNFGKPELDNIPVEDKIAAVLAHEMAHAQGEHIGRQSSVYYLCTAPLMLVLGTARSILFLAMGKIHDVLEKEKEGTPLRPLYELAQNVILTAQTVLGFILVLPALIIANGYVSQRCELEADKYGMQLLRRSQYDPRAMVWATHFMADKLGSVAGATLSPLWKMMRWISTHPVPTERIAAAEAALRELQAQPPAP